MEIAVGELPPRCDPKEEESEKDVTDVRKQVVEVAEEAERMSAEEVVIAQVLLSGVV